MTLRCISLLGIVAFMTACGGRTSKEPPESPDAGPLVLPESIEEACRVLAAEREAVMVGCRPKESPGNRDIRARMCVAMMTAPGSGATVADLHACIRAMHGGDCGTVWDDWCSGIGGGTARGPVGMLPRGAACIAGHQCASGHCSSYEGKCGVCLVDITSEGGACNATSSCADWMKCTDGSCVSGLDTGAGCKLIAETCNRNAFCDAPSGEATGVCVAKSSLGEPCGERGCKAGVFCDATKTCATPHLAGESCRSEQDCAPDLFCSAGVCKQPLTAGTACAASDKCVAGTYCLAGVCREPLLDQPLGASCGRDACVRGLACAGGHCAALVGVGGSCKDMPCRPGLFCDPARKVCAEKPTTGQGCSFELGCAGEDDCEINPDNPPFGTCRARSLEGGDCKGGTPYCARGLVCVRDKCIVPNYSACVE